MKILTAVVATCCLVSGCGVPNTSEQAEPKSPTKGASTSTPAPVAIESQCAKCGEMFDRSKMTTKNGRDYCASCAPTIE